MIFTDSWRLTAAARKDEFGWIIAAVGSTLGNRFLRVHKDLTLEAKNRTIKNGKIQVRFKGLSDVVNVGSNEMRTYT